MLSGLGQVQPWYCHNPILQFVPSSICEPPPTMTSLQPCPSTDLACIQSNQAIIAAQPPPAWAAPPPTLLDKISENICIPLIVKMGVNDLSGLMFVPYCWAILAGVTGLTIYLLVKD